MKTEAILTFQEGYAEILLQPTPQHKPPTIDFSLLDQIEHHLSQIEQTPSCRILFIKSTSSKYFVVGANLEALKTITTETIPNWIERGHKVFNRIEALPIPVVAIIEGYALGGGLELALSCDLLFASSQAQLGQPEASLGFIPGWGGCSRLPERIGYGKAKELFFTGRIITAEEAYRIGLVDFVGSKEELQAKIVSTRESILKNSAIAISMIKKILTTRTLANRPRSELEEATASVLCLANGDTARRLQDFFKK